MYVHGKILHTILDQVLTVPVCHSARSGAEQKVAQRLCNDGAGGLNENEAAKLVVQ